MKVLVIEDSIFYQNIFQDLLQKNNIDHVICEHGTYALEALETEIFDVVFLDLKLPDYNGKDLYLEIIETQDTRVIPITGYEREFLQTSGFLDNFKDYLIKPFSENEILNFLYDNVHTIVHKKINQKNPSPEYKYKDLLDFCQTVGTSLSLKLFDEFVISLNTKIPALPHQFAQGDFSEIENTVHQIKSNCRYFGFYNFADVCELIEQQVLKDPHKNTEDLIDILLNSTDDIHEALDWARSKLVSTGLQKTGS